MDGDTRAENQSLALPPGGEEDRQQRFASGSVEFIGTATVLIRYGGYTILTDPNFLHRGDHVHLGYGMTAPRLTEPLSLASPAGRQPARAAQLIGGHDPDGNR